MEPVLACSPCSWSSARRRAATPQPSTSARSAPATLTLSPQWSPLALPPRWPSSAPLRPPSSSEVCLGMTPPTAHLGRQLQLGWRLRRKCYAAGITAPKRHTQFVGATAVRQKVLYRETYVSLCCRLLSLPIILVLLWAYQCQGEKSRRWTFRPMCCCAGGTWFPSDTTVAVLIGFRSVTAV